MKYKNKNKVFLQNNNDRSSSLTTTLQSLEGKSSQIQDLVRIKPNS